jgi:hypothetical protein
MLPSELAMLVKPVVAYGLINTAADARACLLHADAVVVQADVATQLVGA